MGRVMLFFVPSSYTLPRLLPYAFVARPQTSVVPDIGELEDRKGDLTTEKEPKGRIFSSAPPPPFLTLTLME
ncbi:unnamed protein product [Bursaphelenchus xylophilus]|uniref:(pine wood nematode) hypothetical protein n=1 Tax=Bursaphelenchus xylophilus TaxID=6326 RepID=A0A1I7RQ74_BURXY|nr:unnamed protein product [Bursaphelenchus xylophilus]CAG9097268.1 unnamed protein product [Bursaphelenchus xylophilus]